MMRVLCLLALIVVQAVTLRNPNDPSLDKTAPTVTISTPTSSSTYDAGTDETLATLAGTSSDATGVAICTWSSDVGGSGIATTSGDGSWTVSNITLEDGDNVITVTCKDPGNNAGTDVLTVTTDLSGTCLASEDCFPKPSNTGAGATGIPPGHTPAGGCTTSPSSGATVDDCLFTGEVTITTTGSGATYRYSEFRARVTHAGSGTLIIEYSTWAPTSCGGQGDSSITSANYEVRFSRFNPNVSEGPRIAGSNISIHDNFIGNMCANPGDHADGIQGFGGGTNVVIRHNTIDQRAASPNWTAPIFIADGSDAAHAEDNLLVGGTYSLRLHNDDNTAASNWRAVGNRIVEDEYEFGPISTSNWNGTCSDNRLVTIDGSYNITSLGATQSC